MSPVRVSTVSLFPVACGWLFILLAGVSAEQLHQSGWEVCACKRHWFPGREFDPDADHAGNGRKYARSREIDVKHVRLEVTPDFAKRSLTGVATMTFAPISRSLSQVRLDAVDLEVSKVEASVPVLAWEAAKTTLTIAFAEEIPPDADGWVRVSYSAEPKDGWFFRTEAMGYPAGDDHFWTQGEPERHRHWFPGYDYPNERFTSEVICRVPAGMTVLSNGRLVEERADGNLTLFHWKQEEEHVNYLISVVGGQFRKLEKRHGDLPLAFYTPPSEFAVAENSFRDTPAILAFLEGETGVKFPWAKYYNVCVTDFIAGGMENTSLTTLTTQTLFSSESGNLRTSHRLDAHEAAHQWFGNLVTCKDWSHLWLNEGFATYYTHLYDEAKSGREEMLYQLLRDADGVLANSDDKPIVWREYADPHEQFDYRAYPKGSWVLHMLRSQLGPDLFRRCIHTYLTRNRNRNVVTQDLADVIEEISGRSWDEFFDQWVYHGGAPELKVAYSWDQERSQAKLTIKQVQKTGPRVLLFDFPLPVRFTDATGTAHEFTIRIHEVTRDFHFTLPSAPKLVRLDPSFTVLAKVDFTPPDPLLFAQLEDAGDMMGRLLATRKLGGRTDGRSLEALRKRLEEDSFHGVRVEVAKALAKTRTPESLRVLLEASAQADDRVRLEVVRAIGAFYADAAASKLQEVVGTEANPEIVGEALVSMGKYPGDMARPVLLAALERQSYRQRIGAAAIRSLRQQADPVVAAPLLGYLREREERFATRDLTAAWDSLAYLSRKAEPATREAVFRHLADRVDHPREGLREGAINALGTLEEEKAVAILRSLVDTGDPERPVVKAAEASLRKVTGGKAQAREVEDLRKEMLETQKELRSLREALDALRKQANPERKNGSAGD